MSRHRRTKESAFTNCESLVSVGDGLVAIGGGFGGFTMNEGPAIECYAVLASVEASVSDVDDEAKATLWVQFVAKHGQEITEEFLDEIAGRFEGFVRAQPNLEMTDHDS